MAFANHAMIVRRVLMSRLIHLWKENNLVSEIDRLPLELSPKGGKAKGRCCIHKERAVWKYKTFPLLGFSPDDEKDELTPLSYYAQEALTRNSNKKENILCVVDESCTGCIDIKYEITNLCKGCIARACYMNCPKKAIHLKSNGQAEIDHETCISCGICKEACPYHCIVYIPIPCEEVCPVKAISKDQNGIEKIDETKCIYCGKCINACPFGSIFEISHVFDILQHIEKKHKIVAIVAPSILSQYNTPMAEVFDAIRAIGFTDVIEVAEGAMQTTRNEALELKERLEDGAPFMTTSCCPSYIELVGKHLPALKPFVSHTGSPMYYTARIAKQRHHDARIVFVGPCVAKRAEARKDDQVDYVLTFEELHSIFTGLNITLPTSDSIKATEGAPREGKGFAQAGGVINAIKAEGLKIDLMALSVHNLNKKNIALLRSFGAKKQAPANFVEVMACEGGCIAGPSGNLDQTQSAKIFAKAMAL